MVWIGLLLSLGLVLGLARWSLWGAMVLGALALGFLSLPPLEVGRAFLSVWTSPSVPLLALAMALIPLIGGALAATGRLEDLLSGLPRSRRAVYALAPALLGMLPVPGGALLSSPLVERAGGSTPELRAAANVWFRHTLHAVYPLSPALITGALLAGLDVWGVLPYQLPAVALLAVLGSVALLRTVHGRVEGAGNRPRRASLVPLAILFTAPVLDLVLKRWVPLPVPELATVGAAAASLALAAARRLSLRELLAVARKERAWRFGLIVIGVFSYLAVFQRAGVPGRIAALALPPAALAVGVGWALGFATGRQQAALSLVIPLYVGAAGAMPPWAFAVTYLASYLGYLLSPLHPCLTVSAEHVGVPLSAVWGRLLPPAAAALALAALAAAFAL
ncbi:MAG: DUF401 family protein [Candidatus Bipolaricaulota bacterium]|nr:DUF401 family protein [Candidatus Bipolaricaulota bacterium]